MTALDTFIESRGKDWREEFVPGAKRALEELTQLRADLSASETALTSARKVIDADLQWFVVFTEKVHNRSAHERYMDCRRWWNAHPAAQKAEPKP
jgi:hypothetical protein